MAAAASGAETRAARAVPKDSSRRWPQLAVRKREPSQLYIDGILVILPGYLDIWELFKITSSATGPIAGQSRPSRRPSNPNRGTILIDVALYASFIYLKLNVKRL